MLQFANRESLADWAANRKMIEDDEPLLRLLSELFHRCISLPLIDADVLVNYGSNNILWWNFSETIRDAAQKS